MAENTDPLFTFSEPVILVGGGDVDPDQLRQIATLGHPIVAADGGANILNECNLSPKAIIGDLDSLEEIEDWKTRTTVDHQRDENTTDFEKCLASVEAPLYICLGFWSGNLGHCLASQHLMARFQATKNIILLTKTDAMRATKGPLSLALAPDQPLSVCPLAPITFAHSTGLHYPLDGLFMAQGTYIGTSNKTNAIEVTITPTKGNTSTYLTVIPAKFWHAFVS